MLGIIPLVVMGGVALKFTDEFIKKPYQKRSRVRRFDELEYRDLRKKRRGMGFGDFSNVGW